ncbi:MAG TPA: two pore domain potassium channel family protein [Opitutae bacterium]|nr:two pore domain potassium channel family protein [Opitutae bacterium]
MDFTLIFLEVFLVSLTYVMPILVFLVLWITAIGTWIGRQENWTFSDSIYYAFITATTVGYGDFHPSKKQSKYAAILVALIGVLLTGIIVAIGINAVETALLETREKNP